ncbi:MAG: hypothetical protein HXO49_03500 [Prevotella sp.]|nr:hypothetical protein [Prevotella sp.]
MLLNDVKNYLNITWEDSELDSKLSSMIERGKASLSSSIGQGLDFENDTQAKTLLLNHVMYENSAILHEFYKDYKEEITTLYILERVKNAKDKE